MASATISILPLACAAHSTPRNCRLAITAKRMWGGNFSTSRPTAIWASAPHMNTAVAKPPTSTSGTSEPSRSSTIFGSAERDVGHRATACSFSFFVRDETQIDDRARDADEPRHQEGRAPSQACKQRRRRAGGERRAEIAAYAVEGKRAAAQGRVLDQHRSADRMVDCREHTERRERNGEHHEIRRESRRHQRKAAAGIEHRHHFAPTPAVAKPARRQREYAEGDKGRRTERDQFGVAAAVNELEPDHHRRENQHDVMVERMRPIDEADGELGFARHCGRRCWRWHGVPMMVHADGWWWPPIRI